jgi:rRNA-processing protein FCF1
MRLILDADALIKLNHTGILPLVVQAFDCAIPSEVYDEAVIGGRHNRHADADEIGYILADAVTIIDPVVRDDVIHGRGDRAILDVLDSMTDATVITDDRRLLNSLIGRGIPSLPTAGLVALMGERQDLTLAAALKALEILRPFVQEQIYSDALRLLKAQEASNEEH